jgi:pilus assembly protein CpaB
MARLQEMAMSGGSKGLLLLALLAGLVAAVIVFVIVSEGSDDGGGGVSGGTTPAVVAAQQISAGDEITAEMLKVSDVPEDLLVSGALEDTELVVGETARVTIAEGEQITQNDLGVAVPDQGISGVIPVGKRGVAIEVDQVTAVGGLLLPGDRVDIVVTSRINQPENANGQGEYVLRTETLLQNVEVLSVAQEAQQASAQAGEDTETDPATTSGQLPEDVEEQPDAATLTVALDLSQSQVLIGKQDSEAVTRVWAVQRAFGDTDIKDVPAYEQRIIE